MNAYVDTFLALKAAKNRKIESIGIITPYRLQAKLIRLILKDISQKTNEELKKKIKVATVHKFQGSECDIIIFDTVESYRMKYMGPMFSTSEINYAKRFLNVAMTRAKGKFIIVGNYKFLKNRISKNSFFDFLINYTIRHNYVSSSELITYLKNENFERLSFWDTSMDISESILSKVAKNQFIICHPTSTFQDNLLSFKNFLKSVENKLDIKIIAEKEDIVYFYNDCTNEQFINNFCWFPILIAEDLLVYGIPEITSSYYKYNLVVVHSCAHNVCKFVHHSYIDTLLKNSKQFIKNNLYNEITTNNLHKIDEDLLNSLLKVLEEYHQNKINNKNHYLSKPFSFIKFLQSNERCPSCEESDGLIVDVDINFITHLKCENCGYTSSLPKKTILNYFETHKPHCYSHNLPLKLNMVGNIIFASCPKGCKLELWQI